MASVSLLGCGWLGFPLAENLLSAGFKVSGSTRDPEKIPALTKAGIRPFLLSVDHERGVSDMHSPLFESESLVITLPFRRSFSDPGFYLVQIRHLLDCIRPATFRLFFTSSTAIYPEDNGRWDEEDQRLKEALANRPYGRAHVLFEVEQSIRNFSLEHDISYTIFRLGGLYGHDRQLGKFLFNKEKKVHAKAICNLIHRDDAVNLMSMAMQRDESRNQVYNLVSDQHPYKKDLYTAEAKKCGLIVPEFDESPRVLTKTVESTKLQSHFSYAFKPFL